MNPDRLQKTLLISAGKNGDIRNGEAESDSRDRGRNEEPAKENVNTRKDGLVPTESTVEARADVGTMDTIPNHVQNRIPNISLNSNFEAELQEIDAAIMGDIPGVNDDPRKELIMGQEETTLTQKSTMLDLMDQNSINGLNFVGQNTNDNSGPLEQIMEDNYRPDADLGRTPSGISFKMGPSSPKASRAPKIKKATEGGQKKTKKTEVAWERGRARIGNACRLKKLTVVLGGLWKLIKQKWD